MSGPNPLSHLALIKSAISTDYPNIDVSRTRLRLLELAVGITSKITYPCEQDRLDQIDTVFERLVQMISGEAK